MSRRDELAAGLDVVRRRIATACTDAGRDPDGVTLVAVTKFFPASDVRLLAAPIGAPWLKIGEAMDFVLAVAPRRAFGTHDMTLSRIGLDMHRARLKWATEQGGGEFLELEPGEGADL